MSELQDATIDKVPFEHEIINTNDTDSPIEEKQDETNKLINNDTGRPAPAARSVDDNPTTSGEWRAPQRIAEEIRATAPVRVGGTSTTPLRPQTPADIKHHLSAQAADRTRHVLGQRPARSKNGN